MNISSDTHVPFSHLPIHHIFFYWLAFDSAMLCVRLWPPTNEEVKDVMVRIWNEQKFTPANAVDFGQMADRLVLLIKEYAVNDPAPWVPKKLLRLYEGKELSKKTRKAANRQPRRTASRSVRSRSAYTVSRARKSR